MQNLLPKIHIKAGLIGFALLSSALMPTITAAQISHGIAAVVNDDVITSLDLRQRALFMMATQGVEPTEESQKRILAQAMKNLVDEKLQLQESKKYDQTISNEAVEQGIETLITRNGLSVEEFTSRLAGAGISISTLQDQVRSEIAWERIIGGLYGSRIRISDAQIDETINQISATANKPNYRVAELYIEATPDIGGMEGAMQGANAMIKQLEEGAPFRVLAQQFSSAPSAAKGGDIGWVREGELREEINAAIVNLEKGQISPPVTVPGGVYVIALIDKRVSTSETFYTLKQINYQYSDISQMEAANAAIKTATNAFKSCDSIASDISGIDGIGNDTMGEIKAGDLTEDILALLSDTNIGDVSKPLTTSNALIAIVVCDRKEKGSNIPTRDQVENRLLSQQEALASKRHLRNLRRNATIVTR
ncbi:MAG: peptidylprolyl isomerase [Robiginitomaculum sp.]|nr:peptidylprolyl isomerase [Robiginitomaculum sp.]